MAFKSTGKNSNSVTFKATKYKSYDSASVDRWKTENEEAWNTLNSYQTRLDNQEWLSEDDRNAYKSALDNYISTSNSLRGVNKTFGEGYSDEDEKKWQDSITAMTSGYDEISKYYSQWGGEVEYNSWRDSLAKQKEYESILSAGDFEANKGYVSTKDTSDNIWEKLFDTSTYGMGYDDLTYEYINNQGGLRDEIDRKYAMYSADTSSSDGESTYKQKGYAHLKEDEVGIYNYLYATQGKEKAQEYLDHLEQTLVKRKAGKEFERFEGNTLAEIFYGFAAGADQFASGIKNLGSFVTGGEGFTPSSQYVSGMIREDLADNGPEILGSSLGQMGYDIVNTTGNMLPSILVGSATGGLGGALTLGTSAVGNAYNEMRSLGYNEWQSRGYGALVGASETLLSYALGGISKLGGKISGNVVSKLVSKIDNALAKTAITLGGNMISEGLEEGIQTVLEPAFKALVTGEDFESPEWDEILYSGLLGALSAGMMEGIPTIAGKVAQDYQTAQKYSGKLDKTYTVDGKTFATNQTKAERQALQKELQQGLVTKSLEINPESAYAKKMQGRLDKGKTISGNQLNSLINAKESTLVGQDKAKIQAAAEARLTELGETGDVSKIAEVITKIRAGEDISKAEQKILTSSKYGRRVSTEMNPDIIEGGGYTTEWAENLGTQRINAEAYNRGTQSLPAKQTQTADTTATAEGKVDTEPVFKTSESGKTMLIPTDGETEAREVSIKEIASINNGEITLRLEDGSLVGAKDVELGSDAEGLLYENVVHMGLNPATANAFIKGFNPSEGLSAEMYAGGFREAYRYGTYGIPMSEMSQRGFSAELTEAQRTLAYNLGKTDAKYKFAPKKAESAKEASAKEASAEGAKEAPKGKKGRLYNTIVPKNERQRASLKALGVVAEALGVDIHIFESEVDAKGNRVGANGWFDKKDNSIHIDLYAGASGESTMLFTASHELTHFIRKWSPDKFKTFADFLFEQYGEKGVSVDELIKKQIAKAAKKDRVISYDTAYEEVVADACEMMLTDSNALEKIAELKAKDKSLWEKIKEFITKLVARIKAAYEGLDPDSKEANLVREMKEAAEKLQALWTEALMDAGKANLENDFAEVDASTESVSPAFSERTWTESDYVLHRDEMAEKIAKALDVSIEKAKGYIDDINSIAKMIADDRVRLDYEASSFGSAFVSNVEYGGSFDYTTLCKKRRIYTGTFTEIQKRLKDVALSPDDILKIRNLMIEEGIEATCGLCYVEGSRANMGKFAKEFIRLYKRDNPMAWIPNMADVNTPDGVEQMRISHPEAYEQYEYFWNHYGKLKDSDPALFASQQKPKLYEARKEYKGEILEHFSKDTSVAKKNLNGGIRMQSFSDFEIVHLIDTMQVIMDMSTVGLAGQAYTKVPEFAEAFGNTGLKINLSLIAKGVDADGKLIFDDREGMPHETAFDLRNRYSKDVGTIIVTFTDEQLLAAMADPRIDYIIPFHRSQWKKGQYGAMGLPKGTKDYTYMQNEKLIKKTYHEYRGRMVLDKASNYMPNEYWDFTKSGKENAEAYLKMCAENNKRPKFYKFLDYDGNGTYSLKKDGSTDGYWKLLIDFKMYDNEGAGSPQMAVTPTFTMDKATKMLDEYKGGHSKYPVASSVVDTFVEQYEGGDDVMLSDRVIPTGIELPEGTKVDKNGKPRSAQAQRDAGYMLTESKFYQLYSAHKLTYSNRGGEINSVIEKIKRDGFISSTSNANVLPTSTMSHFDYDRDGRVHFSNVVQARYAPKKGDYVLFVPNNYVTKDDIIKNGFKPLDYEIGIVEYDYQPYYELYKKAYDQAYEARELADADIKYSDRDSEGKTLSAEQQEFFKDSKIRDEDGNLLVVYHGTNQGEFNTFLWDKTQRADGGFYGRGHYFTSSKGMANMYGKRIVEAYLDIKNPFIWDEQVGTYKGIRPSGITAQNFARRINMAKLFPDLFANNTMTGYRYDANTGEYIETNIKWADLETEINDVKDKLTLRPLADGTFQWFTEGRWGEDPVGERFASKEEADKGKFTSAVFAFKQKYDGIDSEMYLNDQITYTSSYGTEITELLQKMGYDGAMQTRGGDEIVAFDSNQIKLTSNKTPTSDPDIRYSERDTDSMSTRSLLAGALESVAQNDIEREKLADYKKKINLIGAEQAKLTETRAKIKELSRAKGNKDTEAIKKLQFEANQTENRINTYDRQLLELEATAPLKAVLAREKELARKKGEEKGREALAKYRERAAKTQRELMNHYQESRARGIESRNKTAMRHKIKGVVSDLDKLLRNPTKEQHVPIGLQRVVTEALDVINMDTMNAEQRVKYYDDLIAKTSDPDKIKEYARKRDFFEERDLNFKKRIAELETAYAKIKESNDPLIKNAHHEAIENLISNTAAEIGDTSLKDMTLEELGKVYDMYKAVLATVRKANKLFKQTKAEDIAKASGSVTMELIDRGKKRTKEAKALIGARDFTWEMLKPKYAMRLIGSDTLESLYDNLRKGEDTWAVDVSEAKEFAENAKKKHGYSKWDFKKRYKFKDRAGYDFSLSLEQIMSIYAYSKRGEQALSHLSEGGFVFDSNIEVTEKGIKYKAADPNPYVLTQSVVAEITSKLTDGQRAFADEMQKYLSEVMGEKGNEVSLAMYDIKLYNEENYFPLKTSRWFMEFDPEKSATPKAKNAGFSKKTKPQAGNPIVLSNFMDVWAGHVNDMSMYHALVLPLEDFSRVYNFSSTAGGYDSVKARIGEVYGARAGKYIENLLAQLNGGVRVQKTGTPFEKLVSLSKKGAVLGSLSVAVQQPSSVVRAMAEVSPIYFTKASGANFKDNFRRKKVWEEIKKYAPIATIKEMGRFDVGMGQATVDWIKSKKTLSDKADDALSFLPGFMDELAWEAIWEAVKKETKAKLKKSQKGTEAASKPFNDRSEEFLAKCGERFTEVITLTQVYDSVFSRSQLMRNTNPAAQMLTAFMSESTTTLNMAMDSLVQGKRKGVKGFLGTTAKMGAVLVSTTVLNSILKSFILAARDDDEDETYFEKYIRALASDLKDGLNPLSMIPFAKDCLSIFNGYSVERMDMRLISDLNKAINAFDSESKTLDEKWVGLIGAISAFFGIPVKNVERDIRSSFNTFKTFTNGEKTTGEGVQNAIKEGIFGE